MAQIQEYLPEVASPEPVGGVSPNIELSGAVGRSIEDIGNQVSQMGEVMHRRAAQEETADTYAAFADQRAEWTDKVNQGIQTGSLDVEQTMQDYDDQTTDLGSDITTPEGKNYFERQQARLRGQILKTATTGQAQVAARQAQGQWQDAINKNSSALMSDPSQFEDVHEQGIEAVDQLVKNGGLPEKFREKAIQQMGLEYSKAAIRGMADVNPDAAEQVVRDGHFDSYMDSDQKKAMLGEIHMAQRGQDAEDSRADRAVDKAHKAAQEAWGAENFQALETGSLKPKDVIQAVQKGILTPEKGEHYIAAIQTSATRDTKTNPRAYNDLVQRISNPNSSNPIASPDELLPFVSKGQLAVDGPHSLKTLRGLFNQTQDGQALQQGTKALFDAAKKSIQFKDDLNGTYSALGEQKLAQFYSDFAHAKQNLPQGANPKDLVDPNSSLYFGNRLQSYQTSLQDRLTGQMQGRTNKAIGLPTPNNPDAKPTQSARKPNESPGDYLKRMGK